MMSEQSPTIYERINTRIAVGFSGISAGCFIGAAIHLLIDMRRCDAGLIETMSFDNVATPAGLGTLALFSALSLMHRQKNQ